MGDRKGMEEEERDGKKRVGWGERMKSKTQTESTFKFVNCITWGYNVPRVHVCLSTHASWVYGRTFVLACAERKEGQFD